MKNARDKFEGEKLEDLLLEDRLGMTVYMPDTALSQLWGHLDQKIIKECDLTPVHRFWFRQDFQSLKDFYDETFKTGDELSSKSENDRATSNHSIFSRDKMTKNFLNDLESKPVEKIEFQDLFAKMQVSGPSLLTFWYGESPIKKLLKIKGVAHPAEAQEGMLRSSFWCDNPVFNLIHSSDNADEVRRELYAINHLDVLKTSASTMQQMPATPLSTSYVPHCSLSILCALVNRFFVTEFNIHPKEFRLPENGDSRETVQYCEGVLQDMLEHSVGGEISDLINFFLMGDLVKFSKLLPHFPVTEWEALALYAGVISRKKWI